MNMFLSLITYLSISDDSKGRGNAAHCFWITIEIMVLVTVISPSFGEKRERLGGSRGCLLASLSKTWAPFVPRLLLGKHMHVPRFAGGERLRAVK